MCARVLCRLRWTVAASRRRQDLLQLPGQSVQLYTRVTVGWLAGWQWRTCNTVVLKLTRRIVDL